jgi:hypothetical protein
MQVSFEIDKNSFPGYYEIAEVPKIEEKEFKKMRRKMTKMRDSLSMEKRGFSRNRKGFVTYLLPHESNIFYYRHFWSILFLIIEKRYEEKG